jgi:hypothetical protein
MKATLHPEADAEVLDAAQWYENRSPGLGLLVIWDAWRDLSNVERSSVIMDAYALVHGKQPIPAVAIGFTGSEAISLGYLPFRIAPLVRKTDGLSPAKREKVMQKAGESR